MGHLIGIWIILRSHTGSQIQGIFPLAWLSSDVRSLAFLWCIVPLGMQILQYNPPSVVVIECNQTWFRRRRGKKRWGSGSPCMRGIRSKTLAKQLMRGRRWRVGWPTCNAQVRWQRLGVQFGLWSTVSCSGPVMFGLLQVAPVRS